MTNISTVRDAQTAIENSGVLEMMTLDQIPAFAEFLYRNQELAQRDEYGDITNMKELLERFWAGLSRMDYSINPNDGTNEHFGTLVGYKDLPAIHLTQQAYVNNYGTDGAVRYYATGIDDAGNEYRITWETTTAWDDANEEAKAGDAPPLLDDESNACDWDTPYEVRLV